MMPQHFAPQRALSSFHIKIHKHIAPSRLLCIATSLLIAAPSVAQLAQPAPPTLNAAVTFPVGDCTPRGIAVGDLNNDGAPDVVVSVCGNDCLIIQGVAPCQLVKGGISVLLNSGDWTDPTDGFIDPAQTNRLFDLNECGDLTDPPSGAREVAIGPIDGDALPDIVTVTNNGRVVVFTNQGDGFFSCSPETTYTLQVNGEAAALNGLVVEDLNMDGFKDVAVACADDPYVFVLSNDGTGHLTVRPPINLSVGLHPVYNGTWDIVAGHFDDTVNPSSIDLVTCNRGHASVSILANNNNWGFTHIRIDKPQGDTGTWCFQGIDSARLNSGASPDVVCTEINLDKAEMLLGHKAQGAFSHDHATQNIVLDDPNGPIAQPTSVFIERLNSDTRRDIVITLSQADQIAIKLGSANGNGTFPYPPWIYSVSPGQRPTQVVAADLNDDGLMDIITVNRDSSNISVLTQEPLSPPEIPE